MTKPEIVVVPHTHWDREWYEPHDVFRLRLVEMIDGLLDMLEAEPEMRFTLDGQTAAIEDYLAIRPQARGRVERAVAAGQLALGPFLILLDEFCCDGETIVRNLELGRAGARALGGSMAVGYLPDMFGHAAQTPSSCAVSGSAMRCCGGACPPGSIGMRSSGGRPAAMRCGVSTSGMAMAMRSTCSPCPTNCRSWRRGM